MSSSKGGGGIGFSCCGNEIKKNLISFNYFFALAMQYGATWGVCVSGIQVIITSESLTHLHGGEFIPLTSWNENYTQTRCSQQEEERERQRKERATNSWRRRRGGGTSEVCRRSLWLKRMAWARKLWWGSWTSPKWGLFSLWAAQRLMHAFRTRRRGCFNAHLSALRKNTINLLHLIQNSAARVLIKTKTELHTGYLFSYWC